MRTYRRLGLAEQLMNQARKSQPGSDTYEYPINVEVFREGNGRSI